jgi:phenylacetic acid degradation operon negative regulatory protein
MRPSTEEFLYFLMYTAESFMRPTWRNMNESFEGWAWRTGNGRRIAELERLRLLERSSRSAPDLVVRLTASGRRIAIGGRDPQAFWDRPWDGQWRMVLFDIPQRQKALRQRMWRYLRSEGFGYLQNSVWVTPDLINAEQIAVAAKLPNVEALILMQGRPCGGESDAAVVLGAWDFPRINAGYRRAMTVLQRSPKQGDGRSFRTWAREERRAWNAAIRSDPLLPRALWPKDYRGPAAWQLRKEVIAQLSGRIGRIVLG